MQRYKNFVFYRCFFFKDNFAEGVFCPLLILSDTNIKK